MNTFEKAQKAKKKKEEEGRWCSRSEVQGKHRDTAHTHTDSHCCWRQTTACEADAIIYDLLYNITCSFHWRELII